MLEDRLRIARTLQPQDGSIAVSIDDAELPRITELLRREYGDSHLATLVWDRNRKNDAKFFSVGHEYMLVFARDKQFLREQGVKFREPKEGLTEAKSHFDRLRKRYGDDWELVRQGWLAWFDNIPVSDPKRRLLRYTKVGARGPYRDDGDVSWPGGGGPRYEVLHPTTHKPVKIPSRGWVYPASARFWEEYDVGRVLFGPDESTVPSRASYLFDSEGQVMPSVFFSYAQTAAQEFNAVFGESGIFDNAKNWRDIARVTRYLGTEDSVTLDFFAGSGTTGHAVINLNREDGGRRRYILVEMGEYFDTVLKPRIQKVIYSKDWKDGKPVSREGSSHMHKVLTLESYEDTLNNLELSRTPVQQGLLDGSPTVREEYTLSYMLDLESRGSASLLNLPALDDPFAYTLKLARDGETRETPVDLVETFTLLLGLRVAMVRSFVGLRAVEGLDPEGRRALVLWRTRSAWPNDALDAWFREQGYLDRSEADALDRVYVNGDCTLMNLRRAGDRWRVLLTEEEFQRLMFEGTGA